MTLVIWVGIGLLVALLVFLVMLVIAIRNEAKRRP